MEPEKKISFGFSKISKRPVLWNKPQEKKVELVDCLEGQSIKVKDAIEVVEEPLIIPIKNTRNSLIDRIKQIQSKDHTNTDLAPEVKDEKPDSELTIDELAERELIKDAQNRLSNASSNGNVFVLPLKEDKLEGEEQSTLEDYEKIPINDFGKAMLRGMGWKEGLGIGKTPAKATLVSAPELRPKGLGLGASKLVKADTSKDVLDKEGKPLILKKGAFAKIIAGSSKGQYGEVLGLDDEASRVIVQTALKKEILTLNEFLVIPVTKEEYIKFSKVLNNAKLEEYKEREQKMEKLDKPKFKHSDEELVGSSSNNHRSCNPSSHHESKSREGSSNSEKKYKSTNEKHKSLIDEKSKQKSYTSDFSESEDEVASKVHKRKDKRRHRDKSRSPHRRHGKHGNSKKSSKSKHRSSSSSDSDYEKRRRDKDRYKDENRSRKCKR